MINDIAIVIILVLVAIGTLIAVFLLGRYVESRKIERFYKQHNKLVSNNKKLKRDNKYFRCKLALNNITVKDMGGE
ncbi:hypothetical protein NSA24_00685 [Clostridioides mangenotii]|uniref:hypothetical protein n=1 Tax=Metaclostridioides mangenotii TaxID=1540 RepID=UPI002149B425|nr:hypothetical protein [Clostridioides mangenotii]MCR1953342.1 hypothetical protein [Clostridioides mangenotii]